jgi:hypothetical protein
MNQQALSALIWSVADLLRGDYKQFEYGKVILPFTVLRRLDCVLESTKNAVLAEYAAKQRAGINPEPFLLRKAGQIVLASKGKLKGKPQSDMSLRDIENVPLQEEVESYFKREVLPHAPDASIDYDTRRDDWLRSQGFTVLRFWNNDILSNSEGVLETILLACRAGVCGFTLSPTPPPSRGRG